MAMDLEGLKRKLTEGYERINKMKNSVSKVETCRTELKARGETAIEEVTTMMSNMAQKLHLLQQCIEASIKSAVAEHGKQLDAKKSEIHDGYAKLVKVCVEADKVLRGRTEELLGRSCQRLFSKFEAANIKLDAAERVDTEGLIPFEFLDNSEDFLSSTHVARFHHYNKFGRLILIDEFWVSHPDTDNNSDRSNDTTYSSLVPKLSDFPNNRPTTIRRSPDRSASVSPKQSLETIQEVPEDASPIKVDEADDLNSLPSGVDVVRICEKDLCASSCRLENCYQDIESTDDLTNLIHPPPGFSKLEETNVNDNKTKYLAHRSNPAFSTSPKSGVNKRYQNGSAVQFTNGVDSQCQVNNSTSRKFCADSKWQAQSGRTGQFTNGISRKLNAHHKCQADSYVQFTNGGCPGRAGLGKISKARTNSACEIPDNAPFYTEYNCMNCCAVSVQSSGNWSRVENKTLIKSAERSKDDDDFIWDSDECGDFPDSELGAEVKNCRQCQNEKDWIKLNNKTTRKVPCAVNSKIGAHIKTEQEKSEQEEESVSLISERSGHEKLVQLQPSGFVKFDSVSDSSGPNKLAWSNKNPMCMVSNSNGLGKTTQSNENPTYLISNGNGQNKLAQSNENPAYLVSNDNGLNKSSLSKEKPAYLASNGYGHGESARSNGNLACPVSNDNGLCNSDKSSLSAVRKPPCLESNSNGPSKSVESESLRSSVGLNGRQAPDSTWIKKEKCDSDQETNDEVKKAAIVVKMEGDRKETAKETDQTDIKLVINPIEVKKEQKVLPQKALEIFRPIKTRSKRLDLSHMLQPAGDGLFEIHAKCIEKIRNDFDHPIGVCTNSKGDVIVADTKNHIIKVCNNGRVIKKIGGELRMHRPSAVVVNEKDDIFVKDDNCLYHFDAEGRFIKKMGNRMMNAPYGLGMTKNGKLVVVDAVYGNGRIHIVEQNGAIETYPYQPLRSHLEDSKCRFLAVHGDNVLTSDLGRSCLYLTSQKGEVKKTLGHRGKRVGELHEPAGIATDSVGNWVVADSKNHRVQVFDQNGYFMASLHFTGESVRRPSGIHLTNDGLLYVINYWDGVIKVFKLGAS